MFFSSLAGLLATAAILAEAAPTPEQKRLRLHTSEASVARASSTAAATGAHALPDYALTYAPISYLHSAEKWFPSDVETHLQNTIPEIGFEPLEGFEAAGSVSLVTLNDFNSSVYLTSKDDVDTNPDWLLSNYGKPTASGFSAAPGTIIAVQKNATWVDVFYFNFYSFNHGGKVLGIEFDDHVGDWEHTMIRFINGQPYAMYFSQHRSGSAYYWDVLQLNGSRPVTYVGVGGHASYAKAGTQQYTIAFGIITDHTDAGYAWDMTQNYRGYWYDTASDSFAPAAGTPADSTDAAWLSFTGLWGDEQYKSSRKNQFCLFGECRYMSGPTGPVGKNLGRTAVCQNEESCKIFDDINALTKQSKRMLE